MKIIFLRFFVAMSCISYFYCLCCYTVYAGGNWAPYVYEGFYKVHPECNQNFDSMYNECHNAQRAMSSTNPISGTNPLCVNIKQSGIRCNKLFSEYVHQKFYQKGQSQSDSNDTTTSNTTKINKNNNTNFDYDKREKQRKAEEEAYYNSEEYKQREEELKLQQESNKLLNEKYCYNYPESLEFVSEVNNCINNHVCMNYCGDTPTLILDEENIDKECILDKNKFSEEENEAFSFLCKINVINDTDINKAKLHTQLTRAEMAQLISSYALKFLQKKRSYKRNCGFGDVYWGNGEGALDADLYAGVYDACQLNLMGVGTFNFNPNGIVKRADFGTVLSRMLRQDKYNNIGKNWYDGHLNALKSAGIMNNIDPEITEQKSRVLLMLYRNSKNLLGNAVNNIERKPSDYYEPGITEEEKKAFDEYYAGQNTILGVTL